MSVTILLHGQSTLPAGGGIIGQELNTPLPRSNEVVLVSHSGLGCVRDPDGNFRLDNARTGRISIPITTGETTRVARLGITNDTSKATSTLNHKFDARYPLQTVYLKSDPRAFHKDLFTKNIVQRSAAFRRSLIAPALFTAAGLSTLLDDDNDNDDDEVQAERNRYLPSFRHRVDDYLQHAPIVAVYGLNWLGVKGENDFANRTALLMKSEIVVGVLTFSLKRITAIPRPDTQEPTSFPSGHTAQAFAAATFMAKEYGRKSIWYSIGAYTMATGVGAMRIMNNRHWVSDVLVGAGIGILATNLVYLTHQYRWGKKSKGGYTSVMPSYDGQAGRINIIHSF